MAYFFKKFRKKFSGNDEPPGKSQKIFFWIIQKNIFERKISENDRC